MADENKTPDQQDSQDSDSMVSPTFTPSYDGVSEATESDIGLLEDLTAPLPDEPADEKADEGESGEAADDEGDSAPSDTDEETEGDSGSGEDEDEDDSGSDQKDGVQKRIDQLTKRRREAERQRDELEQRVKELEAKMSGDAGSDGEDGDNKPPADSDDKGGNQDDPRPQEEAYEDYGDYIEALTDWKVRQAEQKRAAERAEAEAKAARERAEQQINEKWERGRKAHDDFDDALEIINETDFSAAPALNDAIVASDQIEEVVYHLGTNPEELDNLMGMTPLQQVKEIGRLEDRLSAGKSDSTSSSTSSKRTTTAPDPIRGLRGKSSSSSPSLAKAKSQKEYERMRMERLKQGR